MLGAGWNSTQHCLRGEHEARPRFHNCQKSFYYTGTALIQISMTKCWGELQPISRTAENTSCHGRWPTCSLPELYTYVRPVDLNLRLAPAPLVNGIIVPWSLDRLQLVLEEAIWHVEYVPLHRDVSELIKMSIHCSVYNAAKEDSEYTHRFLRLGIHSGLQHWSHMQMLWTSL